MEMHEKREYGTWKSPMNFSIVFAHEPEAKHGSPFYPDPVYTLLLSTYDNETLFFFFFLFLNKE